MNKYTFLLNLILIGLIGCNSPTPTAITKTEVVTLAKSSKSWDGTSLPHYPEGTPEVTVLKITIPPKTTLPWHKHPEINAGVVIKGELTVINDSQDTLHLKAGDALVELVEKWHYGRNEGDEPMEIITFYAGVKGVPITVKREEKKEGDKH